VSDFEAKRYRNRFRLGELTALPIPPSWNEGDLLVREIEECTEGKGRRGRGGEGKRRGRQGNKVEGTPCVLNFP